MDERSTKETMENFNEAAETNADSSSATDQSTGAESSEVKKLEQEIAELKDKYLRQVADFDNYRKRTAKERLELMQTAGKEVIGSLLEVLDDCERAEKQIQKNSEPAAVREGVSLVFNKLRTTLQARGLKVMETIGTTFNADTQEAVTEITVAENMKGKVVDELEKGYTLNDKIIRFAKVVVGK